MSNKTTLQFIKGYENKYAVSPDGRVFSYPNRSRSGIRELKQAINNAGYCTVGLIKDKIYKKRFVHRLVAETFIGFPESPSMEINHKDGDKRKNQVENLEWMTHKENIEYCFIIGTRKRAVHKKRVLFVDRTRSPVFKPSIVSISEVIAKYDELKSLRRVAKVLNVSHETVRQALLQK